MRDFVSYFIISFLTLCGYIYVEGLNNEVNYVKSSLNGQEYLVRNMKDSQKAADLMAEVQTRLSNLCEHLSKNYKKKEIDHLLKKFDPTKITEASKNNKYTSYSINKEKIVLCLRSRDEKEQLIDINTLMFVTIHELAHIMTISVGHTKEFWDNFKFLLRRATDINAYNSIDYSKYPKEYCGITITDSPIFN